MAPTKAALLLLTLLALSVVSAADSDSDRCYFPNRQLAPSASSCWDPVLGRTSLCCQSGDLCLDNTLCLTSSLDGESPAYYRGSCLDETWLDPTCPRFCLDSFQDDRIEFVSRCHGQPPKRSWKCGVNSGLMSCDPSSGYFALSDNTTVYATAGVKPEPSAGTSPSRHGTATPDKPPASERMTVTSTRPATEVVSGHSSVDPTVSPVSLTTASPGMAGPDTADPDLPTAAPPVTEPDAAASASATPAPSETPQDDGKSSSALPIGVGVGVGASILVASSVLGVFYLRKRRRQAPVRAETPPPFEFPAMEADPWDWPARPRAPKLDGIHGGNCIGHAREFGGIPRVGMP